MTSLRSTSSDPFIPSYEVDPAGKPVAMDCFFASRAGKMLGGSTSMPCEVVMAHGEGRRGMSKGS